MQRFSFVIIYVIIIIQCRLNAQINDLCDNHQMWELWKTLDRKFISYTPEFECEGEQLWFKLERKSTKIINAESILRPVVKTWPWRPWRPCVHRNLPDEPSLNHQFPVWCAWMNELLSITLGFPLFWTESLTHAPLLITLVWRREREREGRLSFL